MSPLASKQASQALTEIETQQLTTLRQKKKSPESGLVVILQLTERHESC